jgi:hypothetical protein
LHCGLPCLALETPVLFIDRPKGVQNFTAARFNGLSQLMNSMAEDDFIANATACNLAKPNPQGYLEYRERFLDLCQTYTNSRIKPIEFADIDPPSNLNQLQNMLQRLSQNVTFYLLSQNGKIKNQLREVQTKLTVS